VGVILDTSVLVDIERGRLRPGQVEAVVGNEASFATPVTIAEMQYGLTRARTEAQHDRRLTALAALRAKPCLVIDQRTGETFGTLAAQLDARGHASRHRTQDLWIASLALQHGHKLFTQNPRDFDDIPGLTVLSLPTATPAP
jgi:tRNA(fMet)-specific endonuclease VapC